jgi:hypothetical protein
MLDLADARPQRNRPLDDFARHVAADQRLVRGVLRRSVTA